MSSLITAGRLLVDSQDKKLTVPGVYVPAFRLLADVIQNILDGHYQWESNTLYHEIHLRGSDNSVPPIRANVIGISLWDGDKTKILADRISIQNHIQRVRGNIRILCHLNGDILGLELSTIERIKKIVALRVITTESTSDWVQPNKSPITEIAA